LAKMWVSQWEVSSKGRPDNKRIKTPVGGRRGNGRREGPNGQGQVMERKAKKPDDLQGVSPGGGGMVGCLTPRPSKDLGIIKHQKASYSGVLLALKKKAKETGPPTRSQGKETLGFSES